MSNDNLKRKPDVATEVLSAEFQGPQDDKKIKRPATGANSQGEVARNGATRSPADLSK